MSAIIDVLAGVNGAGKSSVIGENIIKNGGMFYNPDKMAKKILENHSTLGAEKANSLAWEIGYQGLKRALLNNECYAFETTLGGSSIVDLLIKSARENNAVVNLAYVGLDSVEKHIERVKKRVLSGGHDIPEYKIRQRFQSSRQNLVSLMPYLYRLYLYDNTIETESFPKPLKLLHMEKKKIKHIVPLHEVSDWAKPLLAAAIKIDNVK